MTIPEEYVVPVAGLFTAIITWFINDNRQKVNNTSLELSALHIEVVALKIHQTESTLKRQSDLDCMNRLRDEMEDLSRIIIELRIDLQNKQSRP